MARSAYRDGVSYLELALEAVRRLPERRETVELAIDLHLELRGSLRILNERDRVRDHLEAAEAAAEMLSDRRRLAYVLTYRSALSHETGAHADAVALARRAMAIADEGDDFVLRIHPRFFAARSHMALGEYRQALSLLERNVAYLAGDRLYDRLDMPSYPSVGARGLLAASLAEIGDFPRALTLTDEAILIARRTNHPATLGVCLHQASGVWIEQGDGAKAVAALEEAIAICRAWELEFTYWVCTIRLGAAYNLTGRGSETIPLLEQAEREMPASAPNAATIYRVWLAEAYAIAERPADARRLAEQALRLASEQHELAIQARVHRCLGEIEAGHGDLDLELVERHYRQALVLAEELGMRPLQAHCHLGLGKLYRRSGRHDEARVELTTAVAMLREMGMARWLPEAEAELAQLGESTETPPP